jgi:hypothetical protein
VIGGENVKQPASGISFESPRFENESEGMVGGEPGKRVQNYIG